MAHARAQGLKDIGRTCLGASWSHRNGRAIINEMIGYACLPSTIEAVFFDLDGTLVETDDRWVSNIATKLMPLKRVLPRLDTQGLGRKIVMGLEIPTTYAMLLMERVGIGSSFFGLTDRLRRSRGLATRASAVLVEGTEALLQTLQGRYKLAVVTTRARPEACAFLERAGLVPFFDATITRHDVLRLKPNPEPVLKAAASLGVVPRNCLMVGDTMADIRAARRAGAFAVAVLSGFGERRELEHAGADLILERAAQLLDYLPAL
jgi:pyrophosphatase PpaX